MGKQKYGRAAYEANVNMILLSNFKGICVDRFPVNVLPSGWIVCWLID